MFAEALARVCEMFHYRRTSHVNTAGLLPEPPSCFLLMQAVSSFFVGADDIPYSSRTQMLEVQKTPASFCAQQTGSAHTPTAAHPQCDLAEGFLLWGQPKEVTNSALLDLLYISASKQAYMEAAHLQLITPSRRKHGPLPSPLES